VAGVLTLFDDFWISEMWSLNATLP